MTDSDLLKLLWVSETRAIPPMTPDELRYHAKKFRGKIARRNTIEYIAAAVVIVFFSAFCFLLTTTLPRVGAGMIVVGTLFIVWSLHKKASAEALSDLKAAESVMAFHRRQLIKQRDALNSVWKWYLLPFCPGMAVFIVSTSPAIISGDSVLEGVIESFPRLLFVFLVGVTVWWVNRVAANRLNAEIEAMEDVI